VRGRGLTLIIAFAVTVALASAGCGYGFRGRKNPWAAKGVTRVYIPMMINNSLRNGVEVVFTSAFVKEFARGGAFKIVSDEKQADAVVQGTINTFSSAINSLSSVSSLSQDPQAQSLSDMVLAAEYVANASVTVQLVKKGAVLWTQSFNRPKIYPAGNRFGLQGDTSALINSSQEAIALRDISTFIASDTYDTMLEAF
jgi:hypothetical protein